MVCLWHAMKSARTNYRNTNVCFYSRYFGTEGRRTLRRTRFARAVTISGDHQLQTCFRSLRLCQFASHTTRKNIAGSSECHPERRKTNVHCTRFARGPAIRTLWIPRFEWSVSGAPDRRVQAVADRYITTRRRGFTRLSANVFG